MDNILPETPVWEDAIYEFQMTDLVLGGTGNIDNLQATQLGNRSAYLKQRIDDLEARIAALENE